MTVYAMA